MPRQTTITALLSMVLVLCGCIMTDHHYVHPDVAGWPVERTARLLTVESPGPGTVLRPFIVRVSDMNNIDVVPWNFTYKGEIVLAPGNYKVVLHCVVGNGAAEADVTVILNAAVGRTYEMTCVRTGAVTVAAQWREVVGQGSATNNP